MLLDKQINVFATGLVDLAANRPRRRSRFFQNRTARREQDRERLEDRSGNTRSSANSRSERFERDSPNPISPESNVPNESVVYSERRRRQDFVGFLPVYGRGSTLYGFLALNGDFATVKT